MVRLRHEDLGVVIDVPEELAGSLSGYALADDPTEVDETPADTDEAEVTPKPRGRGRAKPVEK